MIISEMNNMWFGCHQMAFQISYCESFAFKSD